LLLFITLLFLLHSGSAHCDDILADHPNDFALPAEAADDLIATAFIYLSTWSEVFEHFKGGDVPLFGLTGKGHILLHACLLSRSGHTIKYDKGHTSQHKCMFIVL
jgi:hypothetical protein